jgi:hypothetical protein
VSRFRLEVRSFITSSLPSDWRGLGALPIDERAPFLVDWRRKLVEHRLLGLTLPAPLGGGGRSVDELAAFLEETTLRGVPAYPTENDLLGLNLLAPTILLFGSEEQQQRYIPGTIAGTHVWAQGFSEPEAGSDLFNARVTAAVDGDDLVLNGQKSWQSAGLAANWIFAVVRTGKQGSRHRGLTFVLVPLEQAGVEVRGIRDLTGRIELAEVFFTDARTPISNVVGKIDEGAKVILALLGFERGAGGLAHALGLGIELSRLIELAKSLGRADDRLVRDRLARAWATITVLKAVAHRTLSAASEGLPPGPESSLTKVVTAEYHRDVTQLAVELLGMRALTPSGPRGSEFLRPQPLGMDTSSSAAWVEDYLYARAQTIYGGSSEIQRNTIAERILGLPRDRPASPGSRATG